jgi:hypothetical protein
VNDRDSWAEVRRFEREEEARARIGESSFGLRRFPRVRLRKGRPGWWVVVSPREFRTKRAAFRWARRRRDVDGERRPLVVFSIDPAPGRKLDAWVVACRRNGNARRPEPARALETETSSRDSNTNGGQR